MQWLVDLVLARVRIDGMFVDRGDAPANDFVLGDLTTDGGWHTLDLSGIVPEHAHGIALQVLALNTAVNRSVKFRTRGNVNDFNRSFIVTQTAVIISAADCVVIPNANREIEYSASVGGWLLINICVKGWWF